MVITYGYSRHKTQALQTMRPQVDAKDQTPRGLSQVPVAVLGPRQAIGEKDYGECDMMVDKKEKPKECEHEQRKGTRPFILVRCFPCLMEQLAVRDGKDRLRELRKKLRKNASNCYLKSKRG